MLKRETLMSESSLKSTQPMATDLPPKQIKLIIKDLSESKSKEELSPKLDSSFTKLVVPLKGKPKPKDVSEIYKKMSHIQHVLEKPDSYVGSVELEDTEQDTYVEIDGHPKIQKKQFKYCPAFYKCFDEFLVNAHDHAKRQQKVISDGDLTAIKVSTIKIYIDETNQSISFWNDGDGIDIELLPEHGIYPPELIFGSLLTSTNYDKDEQKEWGGKNGYGAKLGNIYSIQTDIETVDSKRSKKFKQTFKNNMSDRSTAVITSCSGKPYTKIVWYPDFKRFSMVNLDSSHIDLMKKRVYDLAACSSKDVSVYLNGIKITETTFDKYVDLYFTNKKERAFEECDGWTIVALDNDNDMFEQRSFVNGVNTIRGGKHVDYIADQIKDKLSLMISKKRKINVKSAYVKTQLSLFVNSTIINPCFDGQTKETLKTSKSKFGHYIELSNKFIETLYKTDITEKIIQQTNYKENKNMEKTDGKKTSYIKVPKLSDANDAGTRKSKECTLILTEGDSAKSTAIAGLSVVGRSKYGVFPLKGKVLNVRDASNNDISQNIEINNIKKILGLQSNKTYTKDEIDKAWPLRYGKIMIMTDQDLDGSHIKGLVINLFDHMWPLLLDQGFLCSMITPIIKARKNQQEKMFYTIQDYEEWSKKTNNGKGWKIKYYKGLGTSTTSEAKDYFKELKVINYYRDDVITETDGSNNIDIIPKNNIDLAFRKDRADDRKEWLYKYDRNDIADFNKPLMSCNEFIDKELIHYSNYDNDRSIPDIRDGLKPSTRKIAFSCFKRRLYNEIKVAQLAGYVSENASYHHGEKSLEGAIVGMAHDFVGSNNINLLKPVGQFGTRLLGGKDAAQSRYIFTQLTDMTKIIFNPDDSPLYTYINDNGTMIEPEAYCGILPMILVNGGEGIGTGFSTFVPCYNPIDVTTYIKKKMEGGHTTSLIPWYKGFNGKISKFGEGSYITKGVYTKISSNEIRITELPIGTWTYKYTEFLDSICADRGKEKDDPKHFINSYIDNSSESKVDITIKFTLSTFNKLLIKPDVEGVSHLEKVLKLTSKLSTRNMWLFNTRGKMTKYKNVEEIIDEWYDYRLDLYVKRRDYSLNKLKQELDLIKYKVLFINEFINGTIEIRNKTKDTITEMLKNKDYPEMSNNLDEKNNSYDYLLKMDLYKLTKEEIDKLKHEKDMKELEVNHLENITSIKIWSNELEEFDKLYQKQLKTLNISSKKKLIVKK